MSEEQFWSSNPRIWRVWEDSNKEKIKRQNELMHIQGKYVECAVAVAIAMAFGDKNARYYDEPLQLFELTEEEKQQKVEEERKRAIAFFNRMMPTKSD